MFSPAESRYPVHHELIVIFHEVLDSMVPDHVGRICVFGIELQHLLVLVYRIVPGSLRPQDIRLHQSIANIVTIQENGLFDRLHCAFAIHRRVKGQIQLRDFVMGRRVVPVHPQYSLKGLYTLLGGDATDLRQRILMEPFCKLSIAGGNPGRQTQSDAQKDADH